MRALRDYEKARGLGHWVTQFANFWSTSNRGQHMLGHDANTRMWRCPTQVSMQFRRRIKSDSLSCALQSWTMDLWQANDATCSAFPVDFFHSCLFHYTSSTFANKTASAFHTQYSS